LTESLTDSIEAEPESSTPSPDAVVTLPVVEVRELDWDAIRSAVDPLPIRERRRVIVERMEARLAATDGLRMLFDSDRSHAEDRAIHVAELADAPHWIIGDLHGDLLALEAALAHLRQHATTGGTAEPRIIFLGDFIDDEGWALEVLLRVFELILEAPERICVIAGNHDEALAHDGERFASTVSPSDFADFLNAEAADEWTTRVGKLALRLTAHAPRALFLPDGLFVAHGGFPLVDLHAALAETGDFNAPECLADFAWVRMHPKAPRKIPNRFSRGSQFGYEDFADFCALSCRLGRPVTHMVRGHDHVEARFAIHPAYRAHPVLTTVALSRRLPREPFGPYERTPTMARVVRGALPEVHVLFPPAELVHEVFPQLERPQPTELRDRGTEAPP
jgi:Calcineurin-like phosphoesterase